MVAGDAVDGMLEQWATARPDLADRLPAMGTIGRLGRVVALGTKAVAGPPAARDLTVGEMDVLFALRRAAGRELTPGALGRTMMLSPAGVTNRVDRLEGAGLVERRVDPGDRRSFLVALTAAGLATVDELVVEHLDVEESLLAALSAAERAQLDRLLRKLLASLEDRAT